MQLYTPTVLNLLGMVTNKLVAKQILSPPLNLNREVEECKKLIRSIEKE